MKIIVTTSDRYHHLLPVFFYLYEKYWNDPFELVGYQKPGNLPGNCTWVSLGVQGTAKEWSTDLRKYFESQPEYFIWIMEDTFIKKKVGFFDVPKILSLFTVGRICLTNDIEKREHDKWRGWVFAARDSRYRLSLQPSIWCKKFLMQYLKPGLTPWEFETQDPKNDGWSILGMITPPVIHNEGVRKHDIFKLNLEGISETDKNQIHELTPVK